jgi:cytoskeleton protein RodZ
VTSFGEELKRQREKKKITLDQVSVSTKISVRMLRALEEEKFDQLPGGIFNKGFVRAYSRYLGMDEEKAVADYLAASTPEQSPIAEDLELRAIAEQRDKERHRQARLRKDFPWGWVATVLLLIALGFSLWGIRSGRDGQREEVGGTRSEPADASGRNKSAPVLSTASETKKNVPVSSQPVLQDAATHPENTPAAKALAAPSSSTSSASSSSSSSTSAPGSEDADDSSDAPAVVRSNNANRTFTVLVTANDSSWLSITADGKEIFTGTLIAPGVQLVRATDTIVIRAGNLGGLDIDFNGKRLPAQGSAGEVKTLTFQRQGLVP